MSEKTKSLIIVLGIVMVFILTIIIIWLVYTYHIHKLDKEQSKIAAVFARLFSACPAGNNTSGTI